MAFRIIGLPEDAPAAHGVNRYRVDSKPWLPGSYRDARCRPGEEGPSSRSLLCHPAAGQIQNGV